MGRVAEECVNKTRRAALPSAGECRYNRRRGRLNLFPLRDSALRTSVVQRVFDRTPRTPRSSHDAASRALESAWDKQVRSEAQAEVYAEGDGVGRGPDRRTIESNRQHRFDEVCFEELALVSDGPALVDQRRKPELRAVHFASGPHAHRVPVARAPDQSRMHQQAPLPGIVLNPGNQLQIEHHPPPPLTPPPPAKPSLPLSLL